MYLNFSKFIFFIGCLCLFSTLEAQNKAPYFEGKLSYVHSIPMGRMVVNMNQSSGIALEFLYTPANSRFSYGVDLGVSEYGLHSEDINYRLDEQREVETNMSVMNCFTYLNLVGRLDLTEAGLVTPYLQAKLGASYFWTALRIDDPEGGHDDCPNVLERSTLTQDLVFSSTVGMGVRADISGLFKSCGPGSFNLDIQANYTHGSRFRHMNVDQAFIPAPPPQADKSIESTTTPNTSRRVVSHEYYEGNSYLSPLRMIDFRLGISMIF